MTAEETKPLVDKHCASIDFWTPEKILSPTRAYFRALSNREIDLDPATDASNPTQARRFISLPDDGLAHEWHWDYERDDHANVWVNPPYGKHIRAWVEKIGKEASECARIVALLPGQRFEQTYWQRSLFTPQLIALVAVRSRVAFLRPDGTPQKGNPYGSFLYVYNGTWELAVEAFSPIGMLIDTSRIAHCTAADTNRGGQARDFRPYHGRRR